MSLLPFFEWLEGLPFSVFLRESAYISAMVNVLHLLTLVVLAGAVLIVDLRLLGRGMSRQPVGQVAREARPWLIGALFGMLATGIPQVMSTAIKQYYSPYFWLKMEVLLVAVVFTFAVKYRVAQGQEARGGPFWGKVVAIVSIALWSGVAIPARLIGLLS